MGKIFFKERLAYGVGDISSGILSATLATFIVFYYTDIIGIKPMAIGIIILFARLFDAVTDLIMGILVDKTSTKHGKARPYILIVALPYALSIVALFTVPNISYGGQLIYIAVTYTLVTSIFYTIVNIPYGALSTLITQNQYERSVLGLFRMVATWGAAILVGFSTTPMVEYFGNNKKAWIIVYFIYGFIAAVVNIWVFFGTKERVMKSNDSLIKINKVYFKTVLTNKYLIYSVLAQLVFIANYSLGGINIYYAKYILNNTNFIGIISLLSWLPIVVGFFLLAPLVKKWGKRNVALYGMFIAIFGQILMVLAGNNTTFLFIALIIRGFGVSAFAGLGLAMVSDTIEYGQWKTGVRTEGLSYSFASFSIKLGAGIGAMLLGFVLSFGGYNAGVELQTENAIYAIKVLFLYIPFIFWLLLLILIYLFKLDKLYDVVLKELSVSKSFKE